jgi:hypothetical protein
MKKSVNHNCRISKAVVTHLVLHAHAQEAHPAPEVAHRAEPAS